MNANTAAPTTPPNQGIRAPREPLRVIRENDVAHPVEQQPQAGGIENDPAAAGSATTRFFARMMADLPERPLPDDE